MLHIKYVHSYSNVPSYYKLHTSALTVGGMMIFFCGGDRSTTFSSLIIIWGSSNFFLHSCICRHSLSFFDNTDSEEACLEEFSEVFLLESFKLSMLVVTFEVESLPLDAILFLLSLLRHVGFEF